MIAPKLYFKKPTRREGKRYVNGHLVIRFGFASSDNRGPGYYAITRDLSVFFVPTGSYDFHATLVCKGKPDEKKACDSAKDSRRCGRWLWTPAATQRGLAMLYAEIRKDWESKCRPKESASR